MARQDKLKGFLLGASLVLALLLTLTSASAAIDLENKALIWYNFNSSDGLAGQVKNAVNDDNDLPCAGYNVTTDAEGNADEAFYFTSGNGDFCGNGTAGGLMNGFSEDGDAPFSVFISFRSNTTTTYDNVFMFTPNLISDFRALRTDGTPASHLIGSTTNEQAFGVPYHGQGQIYVHFNGSSLSYAIYNNSLNITVTMAEAGFTPHSLGIAARGDGGAGGWAGQVDCFGVWNRSLNDEEIQNLSLGACQGTPWTGEEGAPPPGDSTPPTFAYPLNITPVIYSPSGISNFSINWTDDVNVSIVSFQINISGVLTTYNSSCYQEHADVTSQCGGLDTGTYTNFGDAWYNVEATNDGDWNTYGKVFSSAGDAFLIINYTKPINASSPPIWRVKLDDGISYHEFSVLASCWGSDPSSLALRVSSLGGSPAPSGSDVSCSNITHWIQMYYTKNVSAGNPKIYEEAILWNLDPTNEYGFSVTGIEGGNHAWRSNATDTSDNLDTTPWYPFTITPLANITVRDEWDAELLTFNATIYNGTHSTTYTNTQAIRPSFEGTHSINISLGGYFSLTALSITTTAGTHTNFTMHQVRITIQCSEWLSNRSLESYNVTINAEGITTINSSISNLTFLLGAEGYNVTLGTAGYYSNLTTHAFTALQTGSITNFLRSALLNITVQHTNASPVSTFNVTVFSENYTYEETFSTTTGHIDLFLINGTYNISFEAPDFNPNWTFFTVENFTQSYLFSSWVLNTVNITFYFESNNSVVPNNTLNITLDFISDAISYQFNVSTGVLFEELVSPASYTLRYASPGYQTRFYEFELDNRTYNEFILYMVKGGAITNVTLTVTDQNNLPVENAEIRVLKYYVVPNTFNLVESVATDFEGKAILHVQLNTEYYKFQVYHAGVLVKTTNPAYITSTTLSLSVVLGDTPGDEFYRRFGITYTLNYTDSTNNFNFEYSDPQGTTSRGCLYVYTFETSAKTFWDSSCSSGTSGNVLVNAPRVNGTTYVAYGFVTYDGADNYLSQLFKSWDDHVEASNLGLVLTVLLMIVFALIGVWSPEIAVFLTSITPVFAAAIGLIDLTISQAVTAPILGMVIIMLMVRKR